jgi:phosphoenolpyruvate carboxykinase (ATP)
MDTKLSLDLNEVLNSNKIQFNLSVPQLVEASIQRGEAMLTASGALRAETGKYTGRSPKDKYIVQDASIQDKIAWGPVNQPIEQAKYDKLYQDVMEYLNGKELFVFDGFAGADAAYRLPIRVVNEYAWHNLFVHQLFVRPTQEELKSHVPGFTVIAAPGFEANPVVHGINSETFIIVNFAKKTVLIGGTKYAG